MKKKLLILSVFILVIACSSDEDKSQEELEVTQENIIGTWLAVEYSDHSGSEFEPYRLINEDDQYTYTFKNDTSFTNTSSLQCDGMYEVDQENRKLILNFESGCSAETSTSTVSHLTSNIMILIRPAGDEAVKIKYAKQTN